MIERSAGRLLLTEQGPLLHQRALKIVRDVDEPEAEATARGNTPGGLLRIGALQMAVGRGGIDAGQHRLVALEDLVVQPHANALEVCAARCAASTTQV